MSLYAVFADNNPQIEVGGNRAGLYRLAAVLADGQLATLALDEPPAAWQADGHALDAIDVRPNADPDGRISFARSGRRLIIGGDGAELARMVADPVSDLADGPATINTIPAHIHFDPTSDPDCDYHAPGCIPIVVCFESAG